MDHREWWWEMVRADRVTWWWWWWCSYAWDLCVTFRLHPHIISIIFYSLQHAQEVGEPKGIPIACKKDSIIWKIKDISLNIRLNFGFVWKNRRQNSNYVSATARPTWTVEYIDWISALEETSLSPTWDLDMTLKKSVSEVNLLRMLYTPTAALRKCKTPLQGVSWIWYKTI